MEKRKVGIIWSVSYVSLVGEEWRVENLKKKMILQSKMILKKGRRGKAAAHAAATLPAW